MILSRKWVLNIQEFDRDDCKKNTPNVNIKGVIRAKYYLKFKNKRFSENFKIYLYIYFQSNSKSL